MKIAIIAAAAALAFCASQAGAATVVNSQVSYTAAPANGNYTSFDSLTSSGVAVAGFQTYAASIPNVALKPSGDSGAFSAVQPGTDGTLTFAKSTDSFTFLWGSPSVADVLSYSIGGMSYSITGSQIGGALPIDSTGNNDSTALVTVTGISNFDGDKLTFHSSQSAYEVAVAAVPEPETYALMLAGLGALVFVGRRRRA